MKSALAFLIALTFLAAPARAATPCEELTTKSTATTTITLAQTVAPGVFNPGGRGGAQAFADLPAFCRVAATLKPTPESDIEMELWLPITGWNGKFEMVGNGGWNGNVDQNAMAAGLRRGYAAASTDTGHEGGAGVWMQNEQKLIDYGHRAVHETTATSKRVIDAFYGRVPAFSYFNGCSAGGRQGLKAAQQYPADFDGIVAGAPALNATGRAAFAVKVAQDLRKDEGSYVPAAKYAAIHDAALAACDGLDGVKDRVIENPRACTFDPQVIACKAGEDTNACLTPPQVTAVRAMYQPAVNPRTKQVINFGLEPGSEMGWATFGGQNPFIIATQMYQFMVFKTPGWDYKTLNFDTDMATVDAIEKGVINARDPNLAPFLSRGGKLIQYHGWADPQIPSGASTDYYDSVLKAVGNQARDGYRLFMVPGMAHCGGGDGTSTFDMLTALEQWVEKRQAPNQIVASKVTNGQPERTRPLCPYPQVATYKGSGSTDDAASFVCR